MHVRHDDKLLRLAQHELPLFQKIGDDSRDAPACIQHRTGDDSHEASVSAAINEAKVRLGEGDAEGLGGLSVDGVVSRRGTTVNTDIAQKSVGHKAVLFHL